MVILLCSELLIYCHTSDVRKLKIGTHTPNAAIGIQ
jgi:hypothetical protein